MTLTGLGLKISGLIVDLAGGHLFLTVLYSALAIWMLGLAVPVTASYIIAAVMVAPAMTKVGVPDLAAHMFIFYYAVLSEVSPPTALSPFAAAAITGAKPVPTMMLTWKYTLPAFVFPFAFTLEQAGTGTAAAGADRATSLMSTGTAVIGILALAAGLGGWIPARRQTLGTDRLQPQAACCSSTRGHYRMLRDSSSSASRSRCISDESRHGSQPHETVACRAIATRRIIARARSNDDSRCQ